MPLKIQRAVIDLVSEVFGTIATAGKTPSWLLRPGKIECGDRWPLICAIYRELTGLELPEVMPKKESRRIDGILQRAGSAPRIIEVDENQHFNCYRGRTLRLYPAELQLAFDRRAWIDHSQVEPRQKSGGWAVPKPPLFPDGGGRHLQRAFSGCASRHIAPGSRLPADASDCRFRGRALDWNRVCSFAHRGLTGS